MGVPLAMLAGVARGFAPLAGYRGASVRAPHSHENKRDFVAFFRSIFDFLRDFLHFFSIILTFRRNIYFYRQALLKYWGNNGHVSN